jgi:hypothetical protein
MERVQGDIVCLSVCFYMLKIFFKKLKLFYFLILILIFIIFSDHFVTSILFIYFFNKKFIFIILQNNDQFKHNPVNLISNGCLILRY